LVRGKRFVSYGHSSNPSGRVGWETTDVKTPTLKVYRTVFSSLSIDYLKKCFVLFCIIDCIVHRVEFEYRYEDG
jgi:hypothetical protein